MSENSTPEERTEQPTGKRMSKLRSDGSLHMSNEVVQVFSLFAGFYILRWTWGGTMEGMKDTMRYCYRLIGEAGMLTPKTLGQTAFYIFGKTAPNVAILILAVSLVSALAVMLQTGWNVKSNWLKFDFGKMLPGFNLSRIFSLGGFVNVLKAILKMVIILPLALISLKTFAPDMINLIHTSVPFLLTYTGDVMITLFWKVLYVLIAMAIFDYFYGKWKWWRDVKMTKHEVKDERKAQEGDEATKRRIMSKGLQRIADRIRRSVPTAHVIVTNPTHYSVALRYERSEMAAPRVVAKGKGYKALRIREIAKENNIPILERKELARALFATVDVNQEVPFDLFKAVAEVFAYLYKLKNPHSAQGAQLNG